MSNWPTVTVISHVSFPLLWHPTRQVQLVSFVVTILSSLCAVITWQESSQCVTESSPSVQTCRLSVVTDVQRSVASRSRHNSTGTQYRYTTIRRAIKRSQSLQSTTIFHTSANSWAHPTLYGVLPSADNPESSDSQPPS
jgi:hypothetical protein